MKKLLLAKAVFVALMASSSIAHADICGLALDAAQAAASSDPDCGNTAKDISKAMREQHKVCKVFHQEVKACKQSKQEAKKDCPDGTKKEEAQCKRALEKEKRDCKDEAKATQEYESCKDARRVTAKLSGSAAKCFGKYYTPAIAACFGEAVLGAR